MTRCSAGVKRGGIIMLEKTDSSLRAMTGITGSWDHIVQVELRWWSTRVHPDQGCLIMSTSWILPNFFNWNIKPMLLSEHYGWILVKEWLGVPLPSTYHWWWSFWFSVCLWSPYWCKEWSGIAGACKVKILSWNFSKETNSEPSLWIFWSAYIKVSELYCKIHVYDQWLIGNISLFLL